MLGFNLKPHAALALDRDLDRVWAYLASKRLSAEWTKLDHNALVKFGQFLRQQRGQCAVTFSAPDLARYQAGLPAWIISQPIRIMSS